MPLFCRGLGGGERHREKVKLDERMMSYNNIKHRLEPFVDVIEPTPPLCLCRNAPIFGQRGKRLQ